MAKSVFVVSIAVILCSFGPLLILIPAQYFGVDPAELQGSKFVLSVPNVLFIVAYSAASIGLLYLIQRFYHRRSFLELGFKREWVGGLVKGHLLGLGLVALAHGLALLVDGLESFKWNIPDDVNGSSFALYYLFFLVMLTLNSLKEEVLYRSYAIEALRDEAGSKWLTIFIVSALFSLVHLVLEPPTLGAFTYRFLFGVFACQLYVASGSLWLLIGVHNGWNLWFATFGSDWKMGGLFEMKLAGEAQPYIIIVLLLVVAALAWRDRSAPSEQT